MKIAVVGGTGDFGLALARALVEAGEQRRDRLARPGACAREGARGSARPVRRTSDAVRGADLVVLAVKADAALATAERSPRRSARRRAERRERAALHEGGRPSPPKTDVRSRREPRSSCAPPWSQASTRSLLRRLPEARRTETPSSAATTRTRRARALELAAQVVTGRALDAGPLTSARALEGLTAVIVEPQPPLQGTRGSPHRRAAVSGCSVLPVTGIPELRAGDDLAALILERIDLEDADVVVVAQKAISKVEGRVVRLEDIEPSRMRDGDCGSRHRPSAHRGDSPRGEARVRVRPPLVICETQHGFICASAGVDGRTRPSPTCSCSFPSIPTPAPAATRRVARADRPATSA